MGSGDERAGRARSWAWLAVALSLCLWIVAATAYADDRADEAEVEFQLGTALFEQQSWRAALAHFLASNRLAQNRNVLFNIALCYERLGRLPEAYRHYARSLEGEADEAVAARLRSALARLAQRVALLHIDTDPPGARLYIDRRDLGERGAAPQTMALDPGTYRVLAELEGHRPAESAPIELKVGSAARVSLRLERVVGSVRVRGPAGASVRLDADDSGERCQAPCALPASPGLHTLIVSQRGHHTARVPVTVAAGETSSLSVDLAPESGTLVVSVDEPGATLEVDGFARGRTPANLELPVGSHQVRVSLRGFEPVERRVKIAANEATQLSLKLLSREVVEAASRVREPVEEAPASISLIGSQELRSMRYPTLAEAVRGIRGVYLTDDRGYTSVGMRGLALPGSYGKRVLVTLDGMPTNDDWSWASFNGFDLRTDLEDIERIEVVRGPGSVVYGTSAFTGVINLVTRGREVPSGVETSASVAADGVFRARARLTQHFGAQSGVWASIAGGRSEGRDFTFPEYVSDGPPELGGNVRGLDGARFGTLSGRAWWRDVTLAWSLNHHLKQLPAGQYGALFGDDRARQSDTRGFVEARFEPRIGRHTTGLTRLHANHFAYRGFIPLSPEDGGLNKSRFDSYWLGAEQRFVFAPSPTFEASVGSEVQVFPLAHTRESSELGEYYNERQRLLVAAIYSGLELRPSERLKLSAGARLDYYSSSGAALNPRLALIGQPYAGGNFKLLFGKAFIAPSLGESSYAYYLLEPNEGLRPEHLYSAELEWSHRLSPLVVATGAVFANYVTDVISLVSLPSDASGEQLNQYQNARTAIGTLGAELELRREWKGGVLLAGSYSYQRSAYLRSRRLWDLLRLRRSPGLRELPNAPSHLASLRAAAPVLARLLRAMTRVSFESGRHDRNIEADSQPQTLRRGALLVDLVLSGHEERLGLDYSLGVYNALDARGEHPVSDEFRQLAIPITGRSLLAAASVTF